MADNRQKRKPFLSANRTFLTVDRQNLSFRIEQFQRVEPVLFLITKNLPLKPSPQRVPTTQAEATAFITAFQDDGQGPRRWQPLAFCRASSATCGISDRAQATSRINDRANRTDRPRIAARAIRKGRIRFWPCKDIQRSLRQLSQWRAPHAGTRRELRLACKEGKWKPDRPVQNAPQSHGKVPRKRERTRRHPWQPTESINALRPPNADSAGRRRTVPFTSSSSRTNVRRAWETGYLRRKPFRSDAGAAVVVGVSS